MNESTKSLIRHVITALGTVIALIGLDDWVPLLDLLQNSLDSVWDSIVVVIGLVTSVLGFFKDTTRFVNREGGAGS